MGVLSSENTMFTCGQCSMQYCNYKQLLEHLYWRHGTESVRCNQCSLKRWQYAVHECHVLPIYVVLHEEDLPSEDCPTNAEKADYCYCRKFVADAQMIGCDGPYCMRQWYHFSCVGITTPPEGKWLCPNCEEAQKKKQV
ncbi:hypothetical protein PYW07_001687 [Mythimna separata]|uniref:PHD-type domain-containing protein n=1 Tax=Mythimna separata TaxID=271217 RepID=A0AAD7YUD2_MYTSE|nr:hypothetical protein PYW07_001687 [Mythimna separata]